MIYKLDNGSLAENLFGDWQESLLWSCMQGVMGELYADHPEKPGAVMAILGDFAYYAGKPERELVLYKPQWREKDFVIMVPQNEEWGSLIEECYGEKAKKVSRYAIKKEQGIFDRAHLEQVVSGLAEGFELRLMDEDIFKKCEAGDWSRDFTAQFRDFETFQRLGLGAFVLKEGELVSGASTYSSYHGGIEIEIGTKQPFRRRGLAYVCGARLILECLDRDLYPNWDAQNLWSVALAEKLGYHYSHTYTAYEIRGF
ncbi:MAG: GNAT family N-acetyltransferase [Blautia sp.]|nr:GNAT family N-acetyltransferase [Blautia sp.]MDY3998137.1 GNAT family N-acetyltransferase [Blautia sp.]